jgi:predicted dehydrogenase
MTTETKDTKNIGVGIVGIGFMGMIHYLAAQRAQGLRVTALCSRDSKKLAGDWTNIQGNWGPRGTQMDLSGVTLHREYEALLADPAVEMVDLCVPNDAHGPMAIQALKANKHVLVEKPIALDTAQADEMVAAAQSVGKYLMVGHVLPFFPNSRMPSRRFNPGAMDPCEQHI